FCVVLGARGTPAYSRHAGGGQAGGITSTKSFRVRDTPGSHLRNSSVYAIRPNHIYEIIPCTRYARITSPQSNRVRDTPQSNLTHHAVYAIRSTHIYEIIPCTRYAQITSTKSLRVRDTPESHLRNHSVYAIHPNHIYEITPCTRYARITSTESFRVRDTPARRPNESPHIRHRTKRHPSTTGRVPLPHILKRSHDFPRGFVVL